jgi:hypothetical protein
MGRVYRIVVKEPLTDFPGGERIGTFVYIVILAGHKKRLAEVPRDGLVSLVTLPPAIKTGRAG